MLRPAMHLPASSARPARAAEVGVWIRSNLILVLSAAQTGPHLQTKHRKEPVVPLLSPDTSFCSYFV